MKCAKKIVFLPVNRAWVVVDNGLMIKVGTQQLFGSKEELVEALALQGFKVRPNGHVELAREIP